MRFLVAPVDDHVAICGNGRKYRIFRPGWRVWRWVYVIVDITRGSKYRIIHSSTGYNGMTSYVAKDLGSCV